MRPAGPLLKEQIAASTAFSAYYGGVVQKLRLTGRQVSSPGKRMTSMVQKRVAKSNRGVLVIFLVYITANTRERGSTLPLNGSSIYSIARADT
jgi:hypothetical protein